MPDSYFLPPTVKVYAPRWKRPSLGIFKASQHFFIDFLRGVKTTVAGVDYEGGYWHGPLTAQQITDITAAGFGARIVTVNNISELPAGLD